MKGSQGALPFIYQEYRNTGEHCKKNYVHASSLNHPESASDVGVGPWKGSRIRECSVWHLFVLFCAVNCTCIALYCNFAGYTGVDCALEEGAAPVLHYIPGSGRCDLTLRPCKEFRLVASSFMETNELTCRVTELSSQVYHNSWFDGESLWMCNQQFFITCNLK